MCIVEGCFLFVSNRYMGCVPERERECDECDSWSVWVHLCEVVYVHLRVCAYGGQKLTSVSSSVPFSTLCFEVGFLICTISVQ